MALLILAISPGVAQSAASGGTPASEAVARDAISQLRSPYCPGLMLEVCPSTPAGLLRDSIRDLAAQGETADEIVEWTLARHGEEWRAVPKQSGAGLWAWVIPPLVLVLGVGFVVVKLRAMRQPNEPAGSGAPELTETERGRVAAALRDWEHSSAGEV